MKESHNENLANYIDHESCMVLRKEYCEALTVAHMGWVLSPENLCYQGADAVIRSGRQQNMYRHGKMHAHPAWSQTPCTCGNSMYGNQEILLKVLFTRNLWGNLKK